ncbi:ABC transporter permease DevC [Calothrix sp. NIES-3974]|uniref:ABC transporter permease DevC n=1 Tax=Calothrix sp. NIES-3974 TaxID=2005462 RepID=UPI000B5DBAB6|nr:ABC transporter permease DevC [Calothrix sp. NIES-3974]BAZ06453.1 heterocyst specific ABC-transporter, membrane spanning subunit DevC homolog [Calothrix sp. NIES-3974]
MSFKIPLAWLQLVRNKVRSLVAVAGISFLVILMFMQLGFQDALYASATQVHKNLKGDLFLVSSQYKSLTANQSFFRSRLYQALGFEGVAAVSPISMGFAKFRNPTTGQKYSIYVIGFEPSRSPIDIPEVKENIDKIKTPDVVLFDRNSRPEFGNVAELFEQGQDQVIEIYPFNALAGYRVRVGGLFSLGPSFGVDGNLLVSDSTFLRIFPNTRPAEMIDIGVIKVEPGFNLKDIRAKLEAVLPNDVIVFTKQEFIDFEKDYWATRTPIGFILNLMLTMASIVGIVIVYQILYSNISSQLVAYATLKAIGYANNYLFSVVFQQAIILALLAYIPGFIFSIGLYDFAMDVTRLPIMMSGQNMIIVLVSTILMCMTSGALTINQLRSTDPAEIF